MPQYLIFDKDGDFTSLETSSTPAAAIRKAVNKGNIYGEDDYGPYEVKEVGQSHGKFSVKTEKVTKTTVKRL
jgi:hypothetical protein